MSPGNNTMSAALERTRPEEARAPSGMRWANGGGNPIGECNGHHLARLEVRGTLCGRYGQSIPTTPVGARICGSCARIAKIPRYAGLLDIRLTKSQVWDLKMRRAHGRTHSIADGNHNRTIRSLVAKGLLKWCGYGEWEYEITEAGEQWLEAKGI